MSFGIDQIFDMLSWKNDETIQKQGIEEAKRIRHLSVLFQPLESKSIWKNCAKVIASKSNQELELYLISMFQWLKDMNWPGANIIYDRLKSMPIQFIESAYNICLMMAKSSDDYSWKESLEYFKNDL